MLPEYDRFVPIDGTYWFFQNRRVTRARLIFDDDTMEVSYDPNESNIQYDQMDVMTSRVTIRSLRSPPTEAKTSPRSRRSSSLAYRRRRIPSPLILTAALTIAAAVLLTACGSAEAPDAPTTSRPAASDDTVAASGGAPTSSGYQRRRGVGRSDLDPAGTLPVGFVGPFLPAQLFDVEVEGGVLVCDQQC